MPLIPNLSLYLIQKFDRLALWGNLTILELHFAETQVLFSTKTLIIDTIAFSIRVSIFPEI